MATSAIKKELQEVKENPGVKDALRLEKEIEQTLDFDGRWHLLHPMEGVIRLAKLSRRASDYLGRKMGWDVLGYGGIDWDAVPTSFLSECALRDDGMDILREVYPFLAPATTEV